MTLPIGGTSNLGGANERLGELMNSETAVETVTGRRYYLDHPSSPDGGALTFLLNLHGGGSGGVWQRRYFPAHDYADTHRLVVAAPTAKTKEPTRHWEPEADYEHLQHLAEQVFERFGAENIRAFWLVGHSQGGGTSNRLLNLPWWGTRVDGWLSLSGGRIGRASLVENFGPPRTPEQREAMAKFRSRVFGQPTPVPEFDFSHIFATGEHEILAMPETSPWADKYGAGPRKRLPDVVDTEPGQVHDTRWGEQSPANWGREPRPGTSQVWVYPGGRDGRVIADVLRLDKGHTEGLEPRITEELVKLIVSAPGGKWASLGESGR